MTRPSRLRARRVNKARREENCTPDLTAFSFRTFRSPVLHKLLLQIAADLSHRYDWQCRHQQYEETNRDIYSILFADTCLYDILAMRICEPRTSYASSLEDDLRETRLRTYTYSQTNIYTYISLCNVGACESTMRRNWLSFIAELGKVYATCLDKTWPRKSNCFSFPK